MGVLGVWYMGAQVVGGDPHNGFWRAGQVSPYQAGGFAAVRVKVVCALCFVFLVVAKVGSQPT